MSEVWGSMSQIEELIGEEDHRSFSSYVSVDFCTRDLMAGNPPKKLSKYPYQNLGLPGSGIKDFRMCFEDIKNIDLLQSKKWV